MTTSASSYRDGFYGYDPRLWAAAMSASYAIEGVKDQREINMMVAHSLLSNRDRFQGCISRLRGRISDGELAMIAAHHATIGDKSSQSQVASPVQYRDRIIDACEKEGRFLTMEDGYCHFWSNGAFSAHILRIIADELDRRNKNWDEQVSRELATPNSP